MTPNSDYFTVTKQNEGSADFMRRIDDILLKKKEKLHVKLKMNDIPSVILHLKYEGCQNSSRIRRYLQPLGLWDGGEAAAGLASSHHSDCVC